SSAGSLPVVRARPGDEDTGSFHQVMLALIIFGILPALGAEAVGAGDAKATQESAPRILYETSPRAVEYQLARLSNEQLMRVERSDSDAKYRPVHFAILTRRAMARGARAEALAALVKIDGTSPTPVL